MKTLTMFTAVLLPLSVIAGIYGMNFKNMPELEWEFGYYLTLLVMFIVMGIIFLVFKIKDWLVLEN